MNPKLLTPSPVISIHSILEKIDEHLLDRAWDERPRIPGLASGMAGLAMYIAVAADVEQDPARKAWLLSRLQIALDELVDLVPMAAGSPWLFNGLAGIGWSLDRILDSGVLGEVAEDPNEAIDDFLLHFLEKTLQEGKKVSCELITGVAGICLYGLERPSQSRGEEIVERCIDLFEREAMPMREGYAWIAPPELFDERVDACYRRGDFNLGVAHGIPAIVSLLGSAAGMGHPRATGLFEGGLAWLKGASIQTANGALFPSTRPSSDRFSMNLDGTRVTWCYGDLGISAALMSIRNDDHSAYALSLAHGCITRKEPKRGIVDAGLCHGAAGNMNIFSKLYRATGQEAFLHEAETWREEVISTHWAGQRMFPCHLALDRSDRPDDDPFADRHFSLLEGTEGVAIALRSFIHETKVRWDGFMLVDCGQ